MFNELYNFLSFHRDNGNDDEKINNEAVKKFGK